MSEIISEIIIKEITKETIDSDIVKKVYFEYVVYDSYYFYYYEEKRNIVTNKIDFSFYRIMYDFKTPEIYTKIIKEDLIKEVYFFDAYKKYKINIRLDKLNRLMND